MSGVPPFGWDPAVGERHQREVEGRIEAAYDRSRLSQEYRCALVQLEKRAPPNPNQVRSAVAARLFS